ncbi:hypothetical protein T03_17763 [Trichinella britovi]|uniref:Uncharacterized protein n=1 Tax=Trichinella britovi TaxID=45882 RepID=A0A0V1CA45_TRIBR|nr:hypothetical protein T03_17763 [Trichinella britovi]
MIIEMEILPTMANNCALGKNRHQAHLNIPTLGLMRRAH